MSRATKSKIAQVNDEIYFLKNECDFLDYEIYVRHHKNLLSKYDHLLEELEEAYYRLNKLKHRYQV